MKKILLITLLLIPFLSFSQTNKPIDAFLGIKFGSSRAEVISALQKKGATPLKSNNPDILAYANVPFGHRTAVQASVFFVDDKLYAGILLLKAEVNDKTIEYYTSLVNDLNEVYGVGKSTRQFKEPYKDGDGYEITGIQEGDVNLYTDWQEKTDNGNLIEASILVKLYIKLLYRNTDLAKIADAKQKAKDSSDY